MTPNESARRSGTIKRNDSVGNPITYTSGTTQFTVTVTAGGGTGGGGGGGTSGGGSGGGGGATSGGGSSGSGGTTTPPTGRDNTPPTIAQAPNVRVDATGPRGTSVVYTVTATDPDDAPGKITISCSSASGSTFALKSGARTKTTAVSKGRRTSLVAKLVRADRYFAACADTTAKSRLDSFIKTSLQLPSSVRAAANWIGAAARIISVAA